MTDKFHWYRRAQDCIAQSALTNSKRVETFVKGVYPSHIERGQGAYLWDHSGKKYLDFVCGLGANILGYGNDVVNQAISSQLRHGASHSLPTHHEVEFAEGLKALFPFCDAFKFLKTGTEACMAAVKIARAKTGRKWIVSEGYHGWSDDFVSMTEPALGVEPKTPTQSTGMKQLRSSSSPSSLIGLQSVKNGSGIYASSALSTVSC
jgi:glutamate-1-semialdehyde aminotransferase